MGESTMGKLGRLLGRATRRLIEDPRVREKAAEIYKTEVKPRAKEAWQKGKPKLKAAKDELGNIARETDPRKDPKGFAKRVKEQFVEGRKGGRSS